MTKNEMYNRYYSGSDKRTAKMLTAQLPYMTADQAVIAVELIAELKPEHISHMKKNTVLWDAILTGCRGLLLGTRTPALLGA